MTENILQDHRAALKFRQPQKRLKADRDDVRLGYGRRFEVFGERNDRVPGPVAQEIEARVVGDAKQPALEIIHPGALGSRVKGLDEGILQYILAIDRRSRHARAVAMKAWPQRLQTILKFMRVHSRDLQRFRALFQQGLSTNVDENLRQGGRLRQEWRVAAFPCVGSCLAADGTVNRRNHVILTGQGNRAILRAADVMARHRAKSSRRNFRRGYGADVRFVVMKLRRRMREFGLRHVAIKRSFE